MIQFKPKKEEKTVISMRISEDMLNRIDKLADENEMSRNEFLLQSLEFAMKHYVKGARVSGEGKK
jgi:metal-responsive CopG/Arc/MetJ family transcriptional regulator